MIEGQHAAMIMAGQERVDQLLQIMQPESTRILRYSISMTLGGPVIED
jgi:hypothetical protein